VKRLDHWVGVTLKAICMACLVLLFLLIAMSVINRFAQFMSMGWSDEIIELLFAWLLFPGAAALWRERAHFRVDLLQRKLAGTGAGTAVEITVSAVCIAFFSIFLYQSWTFTLSASETSPIFQVSKAYWYGVMPASAALMLIYSVRDIWAAVAARPHNIPNQ
jgi:TRAP-type C4-dicarboxylate transport system permease small subunit